MKKPFGVFSLNELAKIIIFANVLIIGKVIAKG